MKLKRTGLIPKLLILAALVYLSVTLLTLRTRIQTTQTELDNLNAQAAAQMQENSELSHALEHSDDPDVLEQAAREKGFVLSGERIMIDVAN